MDWCWHKEHKTAGIVLSNGGKTAQNNTGGLNMVWSNIAMNTGNHTWKIQIDKLSGQNSCCLGAGDH